MGYSLPPPLAVWRPRNSKASSLRGSNKRPLAVLRPDLLPGPTTTPLSSPNSLKRLKMLFFCQRAFPYANSCASHTRTRPLSFFTTLTHAHMHARLTLAHTYTRTHVHTHARIRTRPRRGLYPFVLIMSTANVK